jgi:hypothetical protein
VPGATGLGQHLGRTVQAGDLGLRPAGAQNGGRVAGAATQIDDAAGPVEFNVAGQIEGRLRAFLAEAEIKIRIPQGHSVEQKLLQGD